MTALVDVRNEGGDDWNHKYERYESPSDLLKYVSGLTYTESLVTGGEVAGESAALAVLKENNDGEKHAGENHQNCKDYE